MSTTTRCKRHCWHAATPACEVCCECGRGRNPKDGANLRARWDDRSHGPHYIGPRQWMRSQPGATEIAWYGHPTGLRLNIVSTEAAR